MGPTCCRSCPPWQIQGSAALGEDNITSPGQKSFHTSFEVYNSNNPETKTVITRVDVALYGEKTPPSSTDYCLAGAHKASALQEVFSGTNRGPAASREHNPQSPSQKSFHTSTAQLQQPGDERTSQHTINTASTTVSYTIAPPWATQTQRHGWSRGYNASTRINEKNMYLVHRLDYTLEREREMKHHARIKNPVVLVVSLLDPVTGPTSRYV